MVAFYNEIDPACAEWLRNLIKRGLIAPGVVDSRDIRDIRPDELADFTQCHFFAGIGGWSYALRRARWSDNRPVWTGSCPCQPFSEAGRGVGFADERHLWPSWFHLIRERHPQIVFGEQVASPLGLAWLDLVQDDVEAASYAFAPFDLCAAGFGAPEIRQRLYFVADSDDARWRKLRTRRNYSDGTDSGRKESTGHSQERGRVELSRRGDQSRKTNGFWGDVDWVRGRDRLWRPIEPGLTPLVDGIPARMVRLRAYGNAIVIDQAVAFIESFLESESLAACSRRIESLL